MATRVEACRGKDLVEAFYQVDVQKCISEQWRFEYSC